MATTVLSLAFSLAATLLLVFPLSASLRKHSWAYYAVAVACAAVYIWVESTHVHVPANLRFLYVVMQRGYLSFLLLAVVMYTGVFDEGSAPRRRLQPLRAELSILSGILIAGHVAGYMGSYLPAISRGVALRTNVAASLAVALLLTALFAVLVVTSFRFVRSKMTPKTWKRLQRLSYLMMVLLAVHVWFVFGGSFVANGHLAPSGVRLLVYLAILGVYAVLRVKKCLRDRARRELRVAEAACA